MRVAQCEGPSELFHRATCLTCANVVARMALVSGDVDREEFLEGFRRINTIFNYSLTDAQIIAMLEYLDKNGDGKITYAEFLGAFKPVDLRRNSVLTVSARFPSRNLS